MTTLGSTKLIDVEQTSAFGDRVLRPLGRLARRIRLHAMLEGLCIVAAAAVGLMLVQFALDRLLRLERGPRAVMLAAVGATLATLAWRLVLRPLRRRLTVDAMAAIVERHDAGLRDELISAVQFASAGRLNPRSDSPTLVAALIDRISRRFASYSWSGLLENSRLTRHLALGAVALGLAGGAAAAFPTLAAVFVGRNILLNDTPWPSNTRLIPVGFVDGVLRWPRGDALTLVVDAEGEQPRHGVRVEFESEDGQRNQRSMAAIGDRQFRVELGSLDRSLTLRFVVGRWGVDERSEDYRVEALDRPSVRKLLVRVTPPAYAKQATYDWPAGQLSGDVLTGSSVEMTADVNKALSGAALTGSGTKPIAATRVDEKEWRASFKPARSGSYSFDLTDEDGLKDTHPASALIRLVNDRPPRVRLRLPGAGDIITPGAVLRIETEIEDNLGIASADLVYREQRAADAAEMETSTQPTTQPDDVIAPFAGLEPGQTRFRAARPFALEPLRLVANDRISIYCRARDFNPEVGQGTENRDAIPANEGRSATYTLRVVTPEELLTELARRESEWRQEFEQIMKAQTRIRDEAEALRVKLDGSAQEAAESSRMYREIARRQRQLATRVKGVRKNFQDMLAELTVNQLASAQVRRRLQGGIIDPLTRLIDTELVDVVARLDGLEQRYDSIAANELGGLEDKILQSMQAILANMIKWEGYNEAIGLLQDLMKIQGDVKRETQSEMQRRLDELFGTPTSRPAR